MKHEVTFVIGSVRTNKSESVTFTVDDGVDPIVFLINLHRWCTDNPNFSYLWFSDYYHALYNVDKEKFWSNILTGTIIQPIPIGYDSCESYAMFICTFIQKTELLADLSSHTFADVAAYRVNGKLLFDEQYLAPVDNVLKQAEQIESSIYYDLFKKFDVDSKIEKYKIYREQRPSIIKQIVAAEAGVETKIEEYDVTFVRGLFINIDEIKERLVTI